MTIHNAYLAYKRDTRYLTYWITHASNAIIQKSSSEDKATLNHTGQVTVSDLGVMVQRIADRARSIPDTIYRLFKSVINARLKVHAVFKEAVEKNPDVDVEKSNSTHKHFIDILEDAFKVLGGETWEAQQNSRKNTSDEEAVDEVIFSNTFAALNLGNDASKESDDESDENKVGCSPSPCSTLFPRTRLGILSYLHGFRLASWGKESQGKISSKIACFMKFVAGRMWFRFFHYTTCR